MSSGISQRIVDPSFQKSFGHLYNLNLLLTNHKLSFCLFDTERNRIAALCTYPLQQSAPLLSQVRNYILKDELLHIAYRQVNVAAGTRKVIFVPENLYETENTDALKIAFKIEDTDQVLANELKRQQCVTQFALDTALAKYLKDTFKNTAINHPATALIAELSKLATNDGQELFLHLAGNQVEVVVFKDGKFVFFNTFDYVTPEDFMYFVLLACDHFKVNRDEIPVTFLGDITEEAALYRIAFRYLKNIRFAKRPKSLQFTPDFDQLPGHFHFNLFALQSCGL